jgi:hypothetical protein
MALGAVTFYLDWNSKVGLPTRMNTDLNHRPTEAQRKEKTTNEHEGLSDERRNV